VLSTPGDDTAADPANATEVISAAALASPAGSALAAAAATPQPPTGAGGTLPGGTGDGQSRGRLIAVAAVAVVAVLIVVGLALAANRSGDNGPTATPPAGPVTSTTTENPDQSSPNVVEPAQQEPPVATTTPAPQPSSSAAPSSASATPSPSGNQTTTRPPATTITPAPFGPVTIDRIAQFIQGYYGMLPGNVGAAWTQLSPSYQAQTGGYDAYARFWSTIRSVSVGAITPNGENRAVVSLTYNLNNGSTSSENRWIQVASDNGRLLIAASGT
jgi:eukaryotic-like serine/threonine-protein kinase